jgi:homogentisate 1,2-dioxygenase
MNKYLAAGNADKPAAKVLWARCRYTGSAWEVVSTSDAAGLASGALSWASSALNIALSGFVNPPVVLATPAADDDTNYSVKCYCSTNALALVKFYNVDTGALVTTQAVSMDFNLLVIGY